MPAVRYTALRSIAPGHSPDLTYTINLSLQLMARVTAPQAGQSVALNGATVTRRMRTDIMWNCRIRPLAGQSLFEIREFLDSTDGGEFFDFDPSNSTVVVARKMVRDTAGYTEARVVRKGVSDPYVDGDSFVIGWSMREHP